MTIHLAVDRAPVDDLPVLAGARGYRSGLLSAILSNRKATVGAILTLLFTVIAIFPSFFAPDNPNAEIFSRFLGASRHHLLGTTAYGQDTFSQVIWGTRQSILIAALVGLFSTVLSVLIGVSSAYLGGVADDVLSLVTDVFLVIPTFPLVIVLAAYERNGGLWMIVAVLVLTGWSYGSRQLRSQTLSLRNRDFLESARVRGERSLYIIVREVLPTMTSLIVANFLGAALYAVLAAAGLQFVGLGDVNTVSWGSMLYWAQNNEALQTGQYLWALVPGICIALLGAALALLNYAFDEISNPALRPQRRIRVRRRAA
jgi:peptide/nickel transport system permease protein